MDFSPTRLEKKKGLGQVWKQFKAAFKEDPITTAKSTKPQPTPASAPITPSEKPAVEVQKVVSQLAEIIPDSHPQSPVVPSKDIMAEQVATSEPEASPVRDETLETARAIFKRYDIVFVESDYLDMRLNGPVERVNKNIRMRVRYTCHNCQSTFGHERICTDCQHRRCSQCPRYPPKKDRKKTPTATTEKEETEDSQPTCHECKTDVETGTIECPNCHHKICERCLKEAFAMIVAPAQSEERKTASVEQNLADGPAVVSV